MKKKNETNKKQCSEETLRNETTPDEVLDLDSLFEVQGGQEGDKETSCGLGCFSGAVPKKDLTGQDEVRG